MDAMALGDRKVREMRPCDWARAWLYTKLGLVLSNHRPHKHEP